MIPKFRAWDKRNKMMRNVAALLFLKDTSIQGIKYWKNATELKNLNAKNIILMQATGLQDQEGTEFCEGDIAFDDHMESVGVVVFDEGSFMYRSENISYYLFEVAKDVHIIGNIYENAELLED